jgi:hypothetical protein
MRTLLSLALPTAFVWSLAFGAAVHAADMVTAPLEPAPPPPQKEWTFSVAPYFWMAGINGNVGLFGRDPVSIDESFSDIIKDFEFGGMVVVELHNGTWGVFGDIIYAKTDADGSVTGTVGGLPTTLSADVETFSFTGTVMGEYRIYSQPNGTLDLMAGARIWDVNNDIDISLTQEGAPIAALSGSDGSAWVDPIIGARGRYNIDEKWFLNGWGMIGGFGAASDITWDVMASVGYQWNERLSIAVGYRALGVDYDHDGFVYDVVQHGPILGTVIKF